MVVSEDDILVSVTIPQLIKDEFIKRGTFQLLPNGDPVLYTGGFAMVFPVIVDNKKWAFRCWRSTLSDSQQRYRLLWEYLNKKNLPYFCKGEFVEKGIVVNGNMMPTSRMEWVDGITLKEYIIKYKNSPSKIISLAEKFREMCIDLHINEVSHGDLQHGNILISETGSNVPVIKLVDYDSVYVPTMGSNFVDIITGLKDYQHPARYSKRHISSSKTDYFSELVIYLSLIAIAEKPSLCDKYQIEDTESLLFSNNDYKSIQSSEIYVDLLRLSDNVKFYLNLLIGYLSVNEIDSIEPFSVLDDIDTLKEEIKKNFTKAHRQNNIVAYETFLNKCPNTSYAQVYRSKAQEKLAELKEEELWTSATKLNTLASYCNYVSCSTKKIHIAEAKKKIEIYRWNTAIEHDTVEAYQAYLNYTDSGLHRDEAYAKIEELLWSRACHLKTEYAYRNYLILSTLKKYRGEAYGAIDDIYWHSAEVNDTVESYNEYLKKAQALIRQSGFVDTLNRYRAVQRLGELEEQLWDKLSKEDLIIGYEFYLKQFPSGKHTNECSKRIADLRAKEKEEELWKKARMNHSLTGYRNYLKDSTLKKYQLEALDKIAQYDEEAWQKASSLGTEESYRGYVGLFPSGIHRDEANRQIESIRSKAILKKGCGWILGIVIIICIIALCIVASSAPNGRSSGNSGPRVEQGTSGTSDKVNISQIENDVLRIINGAEVAKANGDPINYSRLREAENLLNQIKNSPKYNEYKSRINALK